MKINQKKITTTGLRLSLSDDNLEIAHAFLYFLRNDLHSQLSAYLEDVFVDETLRGQGFGRKLIETAIQEAKKARCYKLVATARFSNTTAEKLYTSSGFQKHSHGFRLDFQNRK